MIKSSFINLSAANFLTQAELIVTSMTGNADFPEPWGPTVPALAQIQADLGVYQTELTATQAGDRGRIVARNAARAKVADDLVQLSRYIQLIAQGDATKLVTTGFPLSPPRVLTVNPEVPAAPAG